MSIHKYASNVIEKCLHYGLDEQKISLINELLSKDDKEYNYVNKTITQSFIISAKKRKNDDIPNLLTIFFFGLFLYL